MLIGCSQKCLDSKKECEYLNQDKPQSPELSASLVWPDALEQSCYTWKNSGIPPFTRLILVGSPSWHSMPMTDLRYIYHMALVEGMLEASGTRNMCLLWGEIGMYVAYPMYQFYYWPIMLYTNWFQR
jgi:hypothetical protein